MLNSREHVFTAKKGHKASDCPDKKNSDGNNQQASGVNSQGGRPFKGNNKCGVKGHKGANCPTKNNTATMQATTTVAAVQTRKFVHAGWRVG